MSKYGVTGLTNIGNSCFMNSVIQCLIHIPTFTKLIVKSDIVIEDSPEKELYNKWKVLNTELWKGHISIRPQTFAQSLIRQPSFGNIVIGDQCDAHEFTTFLLDALHRAKSQHISEPTSLYPKKSKHSDAQDAWVKTYMKEYSEFVDMMHGQYSISRTGKCGHESITYDPYGTIILPILTTTMEIDITDCLAAFIKPELMADKDNLWYCDTCAKGTIAYKQFSLWRLPPVLMLTLKRFNAGMRKINTLINFSDELDLADCCHIDAGITQTKYKLVGFTNHFGSLAGGHYTAVCKNIDGKWYHYDDASVSYMSNGCDDFSKFKSSIYTMFWIKV